MALSLENALKVRLKTRALNLDPSAHGALKSFFLYWAQHKSNADLQFLPFSEAECDAAGGTSKAADPCNVHFVYVKKENSATDNYFKIFDDATDDSTTTDQRLVLPLFTAEESVHWCSNKGLPMAAGVVVTQHTTSEGTTDGSDGGGGFVIIAAA